LSGSCNNVDGPVNLSWSATSGTVKNIVSRLVDGNWSYDYINPASSIQQDSDSSYWLHSNNYTYNLKSCGDDSCSYYHYTYANEGTSVFPGRPHPSPSVETLETPG